MRKVAVQGRRRNRSERHRVRQRLRVEISRRTFAIIDAGAPGLRHSQLDVELGYVRRSKGEGGR
jgi:hypothetical protein